MTTWIYVLLMLVLLCGSAFFSASEMALSSANRMRLASAAEEGNRAAGIACKVIDKYENALSAILIGNNLCNIGSDSIVTVLGIALLGEKYNGWVSVLITLCMTAIIIVFCESAPKIAAKKNANRFSMTVAPFVRFLMIVLSPVIFLVSLLIRLITLPLKDEHSGENTEEEAAAELQSIIETVEDEGVIDEDRSDLLQSAVDFGDTTVEEVLTPRVDLVSIDLQDSREEILKIMDESPFSRIPVYAEDVDAIQGILYLNHAYRVLAEAPDTPIRQLVMPAFFLHRSTKLPVALRELRSRNLQMAVVLDDYGGTCGVVTLEDILEEIVGDIWDESDPVENELQELDDTHFRVNGGMSLYDLLWEVDLEQYEDAFDSTTVGGWVIELMGRFPALGDVLTWQNLKITVEALDEYRVTQVLVEVLPLPKDEEDED